MKIDFTVIRPQIKKYVDLYYKNKHKLVELEHIDFNELEMIDFRFLKNFFTPIIHALIVERQINRINNKSKKNFRDISKNREIYKFNDTYKTDKNSRSDKTEKTNKKYKNIIKKQNTEGYKSYPYLKCIDNLFLDKDDIIGRGLYATVFKISHNIAVKISDLSKYGNNDKYCEDDLYFCIKKELQLSKKAGDLGIGPKIYNHYICKVSKNEFYLIIYMEHINGPTLKKWLENFNDTDLFLLQKKQIFKKIKQKLDLMHKNHIYHKDLHSGNILVTEKNGILDVIIIDYNRALNDYDLEKVNKMKDNLMIEKILEQNSLETDIYTYITRQIIKNKDIHVIL